MALAPVAIAVIDFSRTGVAAEVWHGHRLHLSPPRLPTKRREEQKTP